MLCLSAADIVRIWELGQDRHPLDRALLLLAFAFPEKTLTELASWSIGRRDAYLLTLRAITFGGKLNSFATCPQCQEKLEFSLNTRDILIIDPDRTISKDCYQFTTERLEIQFRLPNSLDLAAVMTAENETNASLQLAQRCLLQANLDGKAVSYQQLPATAIARLNKQLTEADSQAEILLDLTCPACDYLWQVLFDIVDFFWRELSIQAKRLLQEVHALAKVYGWQESQILGMSALRRQYYLDLAE
ncbi:MAG: hypothetical protein QNJ54_26635 [Prochloraceae cyanobacterium]|nr:hypothetical protein [Prochloraceae cyanobacterium]